MLPFWLALIIFGFFVTISALQFLLVSYLFTKVAETNFSNPNNISFLLKIFKPVQIIIRAFPATLIWILSETLIFRLFPWQLGHTQAKFLELIQVAELGGVTLISFIMMFICELIYKAYTAKEVKPVLFALFGFIIVIIFGSLRIKQFEKPESRSSQINKFAMIQGNVSLEDKHDARYFSTNQERYYDLSSAISDGKTIVIWPETVVQEWIPATVGNVINSQNSIPLLPNGTPIIFGSLSYEKKDEIDQGFVNDNNDSEEREVTRIINRYNSAIAVLTDGTIPYPYHKRILMPFGEYTPFSSWLPFLKEINSTAAEFNAGERAEVFNIELLNNSDLSGSSLDKNNVNTVKISPLICYEDIVPSLARESIKKGAEYLVSLSNDAWFGRSKASYQHHIIALFRSVENRRFLFRSTNTGLTAVVSPTGQTLLSVPTDSEQTLIADAWPLKVKTLYSMTGEFPWYVLSFLLIMGIVTRKKYDL